MSKSRLITVEELIQSHSNNFWEGYLWKDDEVAPTKLLMQLLEFKKELGKLPFVIEGMLINKDKSVSLQIKHTTLGYHIIESTEFLEEEGIEVFRASEAFGEEFLELKFVPVFRAMVDLFEADFEEMSYSHSIFLGFKGNSKSNY